MLKSMSPFPQESRTRLAYLLDAYFFSEDDVQLNSEVLTWPSRISPIFDENDAVSRKLLIKKREKDELWTTLCHTDQGQ